jgi:hypothetical protein
VPLQKVPRRRKPKEKSREARIKVYFLLKSVCFLRFLLCERKDEEITSLGKKLVFFIFEKKKGFFGGFFFSFCKNNRKSFEGCNSATSGKVQFHDRGFFFFEEKTLSVFIR